MPLSPAELRHLRKAARVSQTLLGRHLGGTRQTVSNFELGRRELKIDELVSIASVLRIAPETLLRGVPEEAPKAVHANLRAEPGSPIPRHDEWELDDLRRQLELGTPATLPAAHDRARSIPALCRDVRATMGLPEALPVDVHRGCLGVGGLVFFTAFETASGARILSDDRTRVGFVANSDQPDERGAWTLAHEVGHWVLGHRLEQLVVGEGSDYAGRDEAEADAFAAEFLLPGAHLLALAAASPERTPDRMAYRLSRECLVSYRAMVFRLSALGVFTTTQAEEIARRKASDLALEVETNEEDRVGVDAATAVPGALAELGEEHPMAPEWPLDFGSRRAPLSGLVGLRRLQERVLDGYVRTVAPRRRADRATEVYEKVAEWVAAEWPWL